MKHANRAARWTLGVGVLLLAGVARGQAPAPLFRQLHQIGVFNAMGFKGGGYLGFGQFGFIYAGRPPALGHAEQIEVALYESVAIAEARFATVEAKLAGARERGLPADLTHQLAYVTQAGQPAQILLRQDNLLARVRWTGDLPGALALVKQLIVAMQVTHDLAFPRGQQVSIPKIHVKLPPKIYRGDPFDVVLRSEDPRCRLRTPPDLGKLTGVELTLLATERGRQRFALPMSTDFNVWFTYTLEVEVSEWPPDAPRAWALPDGWLYFAGQPVADWSTLPEDQRESLAVRHRFLRPPPDAANWQRRGLAELGGLLAPRWLPPPELLVANQNHYTMGLVKGCTAAWQVPGMKVALWGELGRRWWVYVEQPDPLPAGVAEVGLKDVLHPALGTPEALPNGEAASARAEVVSRSWRRLRAVQTTGPFEPVRVLLVQVRLPEMTNLRFPGGW